MTWQRNGNSRRRNELPANWYSQLRPAVIRRDKRCVQCGRPGNQVDHIGDKHDHRLTNLRLLCLPCHTRHTQQQSAEARRQRGRTRPPEQHPGLTT